MTHFSEDRRRGAELRLGQPCFDDEAVKMFDERGHDFPQPGIGRALHDPEHRGRHVLVATDHGGLPLGKSIADSGGDRNRF